MALKCRHEIGKEGKAGNLNIILGIHHAVRSTTDAPANEIRTLKKVSQIRLIILFLS